MRRLVRWLCANFPQATFRSGNAEGTDQVFAEAVAAVDSSRLELVLPRQGMGRNRRPAGCRCVSLDELPDSDLEAAAQLSEQASPSAGRLATHYVRTRHGPSTAAGSKGRYLLRDTVKVTGSPVAGLAPVDFGTFYVNPNSPSGGGTGHTIRVCRLRGVPVADQAEWGRWALS